MRLLPNLPRVGDTREDESEAQSTSDEDELSGAMEEERWLATQEF